MISVSGSSLPAPYWEHYQVWGLLPTSPSIYSRSIVLPAYSWIPSIISWQKAGIATFKKFLSLCPVKKRDKKTRTLKEPNYLLGVQKRGDQGKQSIDIIQPQIQVVQLITQDQILAGPNRTVVKFPVRWSMVFICGADPATAMPYNLSTKSKRWYHI